MKKLIAILLSVLMLCSVIPFAAVSVSAADDYYIEIVADATEVNAGDEVAIEVSLYGHESLGLTGALIELGFDPDVFELVTYYDEDEEMWMPPIEVGPKFSASSNKYITFPPIDEETGYMELCLVTFLRATASATQAVKTNLFYTVTFKVKDDAPSGTYEIDFINYNKKNIIQYGNTIVDWTWEPAVITVNGSEPSCEHEYDNACDVDCNLCGETREVEHNVAHVEAKDATCFENGNIEYWYCEACGQAWLDAECTLNTNLKSVVLPMAHGELTHVEAVAPTCYENGNIEYWTCEACGYAWLDAEGTLNTNLNAVILPMAHGEITHVEAVAPTCFENGNIEYWYCEACGQAWLDEACTLNTNLKAVVLPMAHGTIAHVEAVAPTCYENGNIEYWYCEACGQAWLDEACTLNTNLKAVVLPMAHGTITHVEAVAPTCYENGNIEYWYCEACGQAWLDAECTLNTNLKSVILPMGHGTIAHVEAKDATCTELGNIEYWYCEACGQAWLDEACTLNTNLRAVVLPMADHTYDADNDADCNVCGAIREIAAEDIILFGGNSVTEIKGGLAFLFNAAVDGIVYDEEYYADYTNATVTIGGVEYKLVKMGAIMNNKGYAEQSLDNVDGKYVLNVEAAKVFGEYSYAIRIINIPEAHLDTEITARPYFVYENEAGEQFTVYGEDQVASYNGVLNG